jgi:hypothetical protein
VIVGVTGHQHLGEASTVSWVRRSMAAQIASCKTTRGLTSLAAGADQLFAETLLALRIPFDVIVPCLRYEDAFATEDARVSYRSLLSVAHRVLQLSYQGPSNEAFFAAGNHVAAHCDMLLAIWDGLPARGFGGTADVVAAAIASRRAWVHIDPQARTIRSHRSR